jgi:hypothetical protein
VLLAEIVRAADSRPTDSHPAGEGLRWNGTFGLADDEFEREFIVYDALSAECKRRME